MKKSLQIFCCLILVSTGAIAQVKRDIIFFTNDSKEVVVKEVGNTMITYSLPDENTIYTVSKHRVSKITFANGREELFDSPFQQVKGLEDADKVYITYIPEDVSGLQSKGELFSKATGVTVLSSINTVKNRALDKLKVEAAMIGANVVFVGNMYQRGNSIGNENTPGISTQTTYSGTAYSTQEVDLEQWKAIAKGMSFHVFQTQVLNKNKWSPKTTISSAYDSERKHVMINLKDIHEENGRLFVTSDGITKKVSQLEIIKADQEQLILMAKKGKSLYNFILLSDNHPMMGN